MYCAPRYRRGHGGVAILWRKNLYRVQKLKQFASHRCMGISIDNSTFIFSVYLPSRTGCTDSFKEALDTLQVIKEKFNPSGLLIFAGDLNADPGTSGGPVSTTPVNEQGSILSKYLQSWGFHLPIFTLMTPHPPILLKTPLNNAYRPSTILSVPPTI